MRDVKLQRKKQGWEYISDRKKGCHKSESKK